jgi:hypothetical protein
LELVNFNSNGCSLIRRAAPRQAGGGRLFRPGELHSRAGAGGGSLKLTMELVNKWPSSRNFMFLKSYRRFPWRRT